MRTAPLPERKNRNFPCGSSGFLVLLCRGAAVGGAFSVRAVEVTAVGASKWLSVLSARAALLPGFCVGVIRPGGGGRFRSGSASSAAQLPGFCVGVVQPGGGGRFRSGSAPSAAQSPGFCVGVARPGGGEVRFRSGCASSAAQSFLKRSTSPGTTVPDMSASSAMTGETNSSVSVTADLPPSPLMR